MVVVRGRVTAADARALAAGVQPGQKLSTALGLAPGLAVSERDEAREYATLEQLACWAGQFTPTVCPVPPATLLLEIGGCRRLFGGFTPLVEAALADCRGQGFAPVWSVAPTPLGADWLARSGRAALHDDPDAFFLALADVPCSVPAWPAEALARLAAFGVARLGELARLPAAGLRGRLGERVVDDWLRARGDLPDPRPGFVFPEHFSQRLELPFRVEQAEALAFAGHRLFAALVGWLRARQWAVRRCALILAHDGRRQGATTTVRLNLAEPCADEGRFDRLLREHLGRLELAAPVYEVTLVAEEVVPVSGQSGHLFDRGEPGEGALACLERLQGRLGEGAVHVLAFHPDYRPECASQLSSPGDGRAGGKTPPGARPLWLLPEPRALAEQAGRPQWQGPLQLLTRGERLESGWWDGGEVGAPGDVRRDYFVARNPAGQMLWIYRDRQGWYCHGLFA